jgi:hypothetical protein
VEAAGVEEAVGEDVAALGVGAELDLVHREEVGAHAVGHRLDGADPVGVRVGDDALLARDEGHDRGAAQRHDAVVDLARQRRSGRPMMPVRCASIRSMA